MKIFLTFLTLIISIGLASCQTKPVKIIFVSTQNDSATGLKEAKIYRLKEQTINSDFDYLKLNNIDDNIKDTLLRNLMSIFAPVSGQYKYYQFLSTFKGIGCCDENRFKVFHDILIIKTDDKNKILDAYQYTLEWAEPPLQYDLFKSSAKDLTLSDNMDITMLRFLRTDYWDEYNKVLKEGGILKLK